MDKMLLYFREYQEPALRIARALSVESRSIHVHRFPDGESLVRLPERLPGHCIVCRSLYRPNDKLIELMLAARAARDLGARRLSLVAPYLCYMRQDKAFNPGEAVSQRIVGRFLSSLFDEVVTVDAHLHRVSSLAEVLPGCRAANLTAAGLISDFLKRDGGNPLLLGPDEESIQWVERIARSCSLDFAVCKKRRHGDRKIEVELPSVDLSRSRVIIIDDILSTGETIAVVAGLLKKQGIPRIDCLVTHAVFASGAEELLKRGHVDTIISSDSIPHKTNRIWLAPVIADFLRSGWD